MNSELEICKKDNLDKNQIKIALLSDERTEKEFNLGYVVAFIHPVSKQLIFLSSIANIENICYSANPKLPGCLDVKFAKVYKSLEEAKAEIYLLRYHHRRFINIQTIAKPIGHFHAELCLESDVDNYSLYDPNDLISQS